MYPVVVYELMDVAAERSKYEALIIRFENAMRTYHEQNWHEAAGMFGELLASSPRRRPNPDLPAARPRIYRNRPRT